MLPWGDKLTAYDGLVVLEVVEDMVVALAGLVDMKMVLLLGVF